MYVVPVGGLVENSCLCHHIHRKLITLRTVVRSSSHCGHKLSRKGPPVGAKSGREQMQQFEAKITR
jgi:hypothetical protein